jgi:hypothetical protein
MGMLLSEQTEYYTENSKVSYSNSLVNKLKRTGDFLITFFPILWLLFFGLLAVLINWLGS